MHRRSSWLAACFAIALALMASVPSRAGQAWLEVGDSNVRDSLQLLADAGVIDLPLAAWPIPVADIERALDNVDSSKLPAGAYDAALARVRRAIRPESNGYAHVDLLRASGGRASILRDFDTAAREQGEVTAGMAMLGNRWAAELRLTLVTSPADDKFTRFDGSHISARFGNWLFSANALERWWGPGQVSSLILSNNARPIPALEFTRATSTAFRSPLLRWIGPWRFSTLLGQMESERQDVKKPLFLGMRASAKPLRVLEIGISRTAMFCGEGRRCNRKTFENVLGFNDTEGVTVSPADEPGDQLAGVDVRLASPWRALPVAVYQQSIGEDRIATRPTKRLEQYGIESWHSFGDGDSLRGYFEYSDSTCSAGSPGRVFNCAYDHHIFFADGYRYRRRAIGHTTDNDSLLRAVGLRWARAAGDAWSLEVRDAALNRDPVPDPRNTVSAGPSTYRSVEADWRGEHFGGELRIQLGLERIEPLGAARQDRPFGFVSWSKRF